MAETILEISGVTKSFGSLVACDQVSLDLRQGEIHALIGPNGAGKSTLIKQIAGEQKPDSGSIRFCGNDIGQLNATRRAQAGLARTFQVSSLATEFSVLQNIMLAVQGQGRKSYHFFKPVLADASITEPAMQFLRDAGLDERANIRVSDLSHGERRQLEIAIALAMKPKAFLLDEPMAGIGPGGSKVLTEMLDKLRQHAPILLVEHDMDAVFSLADRITVMVNGKNLRSGSVAEIRADKQVREAYLGERAEH